MRAFGLVSTAVLSLTLGLAVPAFTQEQREPQENQKSKPVREDEKKAQPAPKQEEKNTQQEEKNTKSSEKNAQQQEKNTRQEEKNTQQAQRGDNRGGRIPEERFKANFGREHSFHVTQEDYRGHRFQYGGYSFGFIDPWPANWLYTQDVYVVEINGIYYLCNPMYPGVNLALSFTL